MKGMKANEAPEKIYLTKNLLGELCDGWDALPAETFISIEYTRTDAFIEKACEWLRTHSEMDFFELIPVANYCGAGNFNKKKMIEDFRNYMKGE